ncbi:MAG TPA: PorV/PorQ family protein [Ignavibacteria bacterium]
MKKEINVLLLFLIIISNYSYAQIVKRAQAGFRFLENPISAEAVGRGATGVATMQNSNAVFWNPAGISWMNSNVDVNFNYTKGIADINYFSTSLAFDAWGFGVISINGIMMDYGDFYGTRRADNESGYIETGTFSPKALALGLAFSQKVSSNFSYGVNVKYVYQDLGDVWVGSGTSLNDPSLQLLTKNYSLGDFAVDIGALYDFNYHGIMFGASLQNVSRELKYEDQKFPMPFAVSFGLTVDPISFLIPDLKDHSFKFIIESRHPRDFKEKIKYGLEYKFMDLFTVRTGYMSNLDERGFTAGIGVNQNLFDTNLKVDYAYENFGIFGAVHFFSIGVRY